MEITTDEFVRLVIMQEKVEELVNICYSGKDYTWAGRIFILQNKRFLELIYELYQLCIGDKVKEKSK